MMSPGGFESQVKSGKSGLDLSFECHELDGGTPWMVSKVSALQGFSGTREGCVSPPFFRGRLK